MPKTHPYFASNIYLNNLHQIWKPSVVSGCFLNKESGLRVSGIPKLITVMASLIDGRSELIDEVKSSYQDFKDTIASVNGIHLHNDEAITRVIRREITGQYVLRSELEAGRGERDGGGNNLAKKSYNWRDEDHPFPSDFKFPCVDSAKLWNLWIFGNGNDINTPYRSFRGDFMSKPDRIQLSKSRTLMEAVRAEIGMSYSEIHDSGRDRSEQLFDVAFKSLFGGVKGYKRMNSANAYKYLMKFRKGSD